MPIEPVCLNPIVLSPIVLNSLRCAESSEAESRLSASIPEMGGLEPRDRFAGIVPGNVQQSAARAPSVCTLGLVAGLLSYFALNPSVAEAAVTTTKGAAQAFFPLTPYGAIGLSIGFVAGLFGLIKTGNGGKTPDNPDEKALVKRDAGPSALVRAAKSSGRFLLKAWRGYCSIANYFWKPYLKLNKIFGEMFVDMWRDPDGSLQRMRSEFETMLEKSSSFRGGPLQGTYFDKSLASPILCLAFDFERGKFVRIRSTPAADVQNLRSIFKRSGAFAVFDAETQTLLHYEMGEGPKKGLEYWLKLYSKYTGKDREAFPQAHPYDLPLVFNRQDSLFMKDVVRSLDEILRRHARASIDAGDLRNNPYDTTALLRVYEVDHSPPQTPRSYFRVGISHDPSWKTWRLAGAIEVTFASVPEMDWSHPGPMTYRVRSGYLPANVEDGLRWMAGRIDAYWNRRRSELPRAFARPKRP